MSIEHEQTQVCEACGCAGEIGFIIKEGDDVADVTIYAGSKELLASRVCQISATCQIGKRKRRIQHY